MACVTETGSDNSANRKHCDSDELPTHALYTRTILFLSGGWNVGSLARFSQHPPKAEGFLMAWPPRSFSSINVFVSNEGRTPFEGFPTI